MAVIKKQTIPPSNVMIDVLEHCTRISHVAPQHMRQKSVRTNNEKSHRWHEGEKGIDDYVGRRIGS